MKAIIVAAGMGRRLRPYTDDRPKCLVEINGKSILQRQLDAYRAAGIDEVHIVRGYMKESIVVDRLLQSTETLRAHKQAIFGQMETLLFAALRDVWTEPALLPTLRMVAMVAIGVMRLAMETWRQERGKRPLAGYVKEGFALLKSKV